QPVQAESGQPFLNVSFLPASDEESHVGEAAAEQHPQNLDFETISGPFNIDSFPGFAAKIDLVHQTLSSKITSSADKIATLLSLKEKTDLFGGTVTMINLAEALRDTARSGAEYKVADRTDEIEAEKETENEAIKNAEEALTQYQLAYAQHNGLLQELLGLQNPVTDDLLRALYERYLEISQDDENTTSFEAFTNALFDENNQYLNRLNDLVAESRQKVIDAHKELDAVKALQHSEIEYDFFRRSPQSGLGNWFQTNTFVDTFTTFNGSWDIRQIGNFFDSIRSSLLDADQNKFMRVLVITALIATTFFYFSAKSFQTTGAFCLALGATTVAALAHAVFKFVRWCGVGLKSNTYDPIVRNLNVPKDEDQANKTRIADPNRKLVIAAHFATNPRNLAVKRVASSSLEALIPRRKGVKGRKKKPVQIKHLRPLGSMRQVTKLTLDFNAAALLDSSSQRLNSAPISHRVPHNPANCKSEIIFAESAQQQLDSQKYNSALTRAVSADELTQSYGNILSSSQVLGSRSAQGANVQQSWRSKTVNFFFGQSKKQFSCPDKYTPDYVPARNAELEAKTKQDGINRIVRR
ncbi:MAG: hypothetical protein KGQ54_05380, partial [Verrucomicrobia bacterium]|nr:hypothetical protein [Verrucomicrobiota bacterium]